MRSRFRRLFLLASLAALLPLAGQTPPPLPGAGGSSGGFLYQPGVSSNAAGGATDAFSGLKLAPPPEQRTAEQLQAVLESYAGRWVGQLDLFVVRPSGVMRRAAMPIEMNYTIVKRQGQRIIKCVLSYNLEDKPTTELTYRWVQNGKIISEFIQGERIERHVASTRGPSLLWSAEIRGLTPTDYGVTETLRLTPDGGVLNMVGYMRLPGSEPPELLQLVGELKMVSPAPDTVPDIDTVTVIDELRRGPGQ